MARAIDRNWKQRPRCFNKARAKERTRWLTCSAGHRHIAWVPVQESDPVRPCPECGAVAQSEPQPGAPDAPFVQSDWRPRVLENLGHEPVRIESRQHYYRELKQRHLTNGWV